jgi:pyridoxine/pyridoxamine 5'-phosphate oxidase
VIIFQNLSKETPYQIFQEKYKDAFEAKQKNIEAICISSFSKENDEVNSRFVNLKFVREKEFIFFSNYNAPKSIEFSDH